MKVTKLNRYVLCVLLATMILTVIFEQFLFISPVLATNDAGLAEICINQEIHARYADTDINITYAGQSSDNVTSYDMLLISGSLENLSISDSKGKQLIHSAEKRLNVTRITYIFSHGLSPGESYTVYCSYRQSTLRESSTDFSYTTGIDWPGTAGIEKVTVLFAPGTALKSSSYLPHSISTIEGGWLRLMWFETSKAGFFSGFSYSRSLIYSLEIEPLNWDAGTITLNGSVMPLSTIVFFNDGDKAVEIWLETEEWFAVNISGFILPAGARQAVDCQITTTRSGIYSASLKIHANISQNYVYTVRISVTLENTANSFGPFFAVAIVVMIAAAGGISLYIVNKRKGFISFTSHSNRLTGNTAAEVVPHEVIDPIDSATELVGPDPIIVERLNAMKDLLNEKEYSVLEVLLENNGISQQEIVSETGISKATVSRVINRLLSKRLVEKKQTGMSNLIYLGKRLVK